jgi:hypothetical protein
MFRRKMLQAYDHDFLRSVELVSKGRNTNGMVYVELVEILAAASG